MKEHITDTITVSTVESETTCLVTKDTIPAESLIVELGEPHRTVSVEGAKQVSKQLSKLVKTDGQYNKLGVFLADCKSDTFNCKYCNELIESGDKATVYTLSASDSLWVHYPTCTKQLSNALDSVTDYLPKFTSERL